ncbi:MAG: 2Fe-2S iron-sulfur cluster binding domain-containing protein [Ignavibacteriae bacterium]|nr:2Fe-2S iron-sulfur cluster binding domain-containing protein [Ignavibacteriota bacterium]
MSFRLYPLKVKKTDKLTKDAVAVYFEIPEDLKRTFRYKQGQFLSLQIEINGEKYRREYSLCSSPYSDEDHVIASKVIGNGVVSSYLYNVLKEGDILQVYPPQGKFFTELHDTNEKTYFLIGGGSGITPLFSILKSVLHAEPKSKIILYYGNLNEECIMFKNELNELSEKYADRFKLYNTLSETDSGWTDLKGIINKEDLIRIINDNSVNKTTSEFFICGPGEMMDIVKETLLNDKIPSDKIHIEYFTAPVHHEEYVPEGEENDVVVEREVRIILDGSEYSVTVPPDTVILDAAIKADLDPPFSCKSGICTTCRAKLYSGKVKMDEREGLSDSEIDEGYILTCQSHPLTDDVKLEYM